MRLIVLVTFFSYITAYPRAIPADQEDAHLTVPEIITKYGYPAEIHHVTTSDGYILTMHRIPHGKDSNTTSVKPVLVQHGLLSSSADFIIAGVTHGLGFLLADAGYDVWLGNGRGNHISRNHTTLDPDTDAEYWHFSWHEIGTIDLPSMIDHIIEATDQSRIYYVGHSQGSTTFYVMTSTRPEYNDKIISSYSLAPVGFMSRLTSPLVRILAEWQGPMDALFELLGWNEFLPKNELVSSASEALCQNEEVICSNFIFLLCGYSPSELNTTLLPIVLGHSPAGASTRQIIHYLQEVKSGFFRQYDFGLGNLLIYGSLSPPEYNLSKITAPNYMFYSHNDLMANEEDVTQLCVEMGDACAGQFLVSEDTFNHLDFLFGIRAPELVYSKVIDLMTRH